MRNTIKLIFLLMCSACNAFPVLEEETGYDSVNIYFVDWRYQPRYTLKPKRIRENPHLTVAVYNQVYIHNIKSLLKISSLKPVSDINGFYIGEIRNKEEISEILNSTENNVELINTRLVIDFNKKDGGKETYISDGDWLFNATADKARALDAAFKRRIDSLVGKPASEN